MKNIFFKLSSQKQKEISIEICAKYWISKISRSVDVDTKKHAKISSQKLVNLWLNACVNNLIVFM